MFTLKTGFQLLCLIRIRKYIKKVKTNNNVSFECSRLWRVQQRCQIVVYVTMRSMKNFNYLYCD